GITLARPCRRRPGAPHVSFPAARKERTSMTRTIDRLVRIWCSLAVTLVLGLVAAAPVRAGCITDGQGTDDVPGQKDLSKLCEPSPTCSSSSTTLSLLWQFDDTSWSGGNTGYACALIDANRDGPAHRA